VDFTGEKKMKIKVLDKNAVIPKYAKPGDAGMDLTSIEALTIPARSRVVVHTGIAIALDEGYEAQIRPRSGFAAKMGVTVLNSPGTIDSGYRGELMVILFNSSGDNVGIGIGDRIAQMVIAKYEQPTIEVVDDLDETERGTGGLGSTGTN
jgi:dUTP pyrophosphatase